MVERCRLEVGEVLTVEEVENNIVIIDKKKKDDDYWKTNISTFKNYYLVRSL